MLQSIFPHPRLSEGPSSVPDYGDLVHFPATAALLSLLLVGISCALPLYGVGGGLT